MFTISIELLLLIGVDYLYIDIGVCTFKSRFFILSKADECTGFSIFGCNYPCCVL